MGKIYRVKGKDNTVKYPLTVSDAVVVGDKTLTEKLKEYHNIKPLMAKMYTGLYYGANSTSNGYFEPICVKPKDPTKTVGEYYIKFKMSTTSEKYPNYKNFSIVELWFNRTGSINCSRIWNWRVGSYLHYLVGASYPSTNDDFNTIGTHLGVGIVAGNNYNSANYKRDTLIEVYEISDDLTFTMDEPEDNKQYTLMSWYDSAKITHSTYNAYDVGLQETGDSNTYDRTILSSARFYVASDVRFHGYSLAFFDKDGKINPLSYCGTSYTTAAYTKASGTRKYTTKGLVWENGIMYYGTSSNHVGDSLVNTSSLYYTVPGVDLRYSDNTIASNVATNTLGTEDAKNIYIRGVIKEDGLFYIRPADVTYNNNIYQKAWTQNPEDGWDEDGYRYVYWFLAYYYYNSSYPVRGYLYTLPINNPVYVVEDDRLIEYNSYINSQKQDIIKDLDTIREGARNGATSVQQADISDMETKTHASQTYQPKGDYLVAADIANKVDKVSGKGLSTNDFTTALKNKLDGIAAGAEVNVQSDWNVTDSNSDAYIKNKPTIPSAVTESTVSGWGFTKNTGTYSKPSSGIPKTDLSQDVQTLLDKADNALRAGDNVSALVNDSGYVLAIDSDTVVEPLEQTILDRVDSVVLEHLGEIGTGGGGTSTQVQSDWNETSTTSAAFIKNKPTIPDISGKADKSTTYTKTEIDAMIGDIETLLAAL